MAHSPTADGLGHGYLRGRTASWFAGNSGFHRPTSASIWRKRTYSRIALSEGGRWVGLVRDSSGFSPGRWTNGLLYVSLEMTAAHATSATFATRSLGQLRLSSSASLKSSKWLPLPVPIPIRKNYAHRIHRGVCVPSAAVSQRQRRPQGLSERRCHSCVRRLTRFRDGLDAIMATADLQGREFPTNEKRKWPAAGEHLAEHCALLAETGMLPPRTELASSLPATCIPRELLDKRGGSGDVRRCGRRLCNASDGLPGCWQSRFLWQNTFSSTSKAFLRQPKTRFTGWPRSQLDGLKIGGLSGVVGDSTRKLFRREEKVFAKRNQTARRRLSTCW